MGFAWLGSAANAREKRRGGDFYRAWRNLPGEAACPGCRDGFVPLEFHQDAAAGRGMR